MNFKTFCTTSLSVLCLGNASICLSTGAPVAHQFQGGQPASASQVNANFQELADRVSGILNNSVYDYRQYLSTASSKTFSISGDFCGDTESRTYSRTTSGADTDINISRIRSTGATTCQNRQFYYTATPSNYVLNRIESNDNNGALQTTARNQPAEIRQTAAMGMGRKFSYHTEYYNTPAGGSETFTGVLINSFVVTDVESVTVTAGTFNNCIKLRTNFAYPGFIRQRISWRCPAVGEVKRVQVETGSSISRRWELTGITLP